MSDALVIDDERRQESIGVERGLSVAANEAVGRGVDALHLVEDDALVGQRGIEGV